MEVYVRDVLWKDMEIYDKFSGVVMFAFEDGTELMQIFGKVHQKREKDPDNGVFTIQEIMVIEGQLPPP